MAKSKIHLFALEAFLTLTVLYYFLRFQWGWDLGVVAIQVGLLLWFSSVGFANYLAEYRRASYKGPLYGLAITYSIVLLGITAIRGGSDGILYGLKDYILPLMLLFYFSASIDPKGIPKLFRVMAVLGVVVAIIYMIEFYVRYVLFDGYLTYTEGIRALSESKGMFGIAVSEFQGKEDSFFRLPGPLSHSSSTGLLVAVSLLALLPLLGREGNKWVYLVLVVSLFGFVLIGARTAWIAFLFGYLYYNARRIDKYLLSMLSLVLVLFVIALNHQGFSEVLNISRFLGTLEDILLKAHVVEAERFYNILIGSGFNYPGMSGREYLAYRPVLEDDLFILQLVTMYGLVPFVLFVYFFFEPFKKRTNALLSDPYWRASRGIVICFLVSSFHTNAIVRPQLFPVFVLFVAIAGLIEYRARLAKA